MLKIKFYGYECEWSSERMSWSCSIEYIQQLINSITYTILVPSLSYSTPFLQGGLNKAVWDALLKAHGDACELISMEDDSVESKPKAGEYH